MRNKWKWVNLRILLFVCPNSHWSLKIYFKKWRPGLCCTSESRYLQIETFYFHMLPLVWLQNPALISFLLHFCLLTQLCWCLDVVWHQSLQSRLPCEASSWSYLLGEKCGDSHSNQFLPVFIYRKGQLTVCCWFFFLRTCFSPLLLCLEKGVCHVPDSPQFK